MSRAPLATSASIGRDLMNQAKEKSRVQSEEQPPIQRLDRSHQSPMVFQKKTLMSISRHRAKRIEHRGLDVWHSPDDEVSNGPKACFYRMQNSCQEGRCTHYNCECSC